MHVTLSLSPQFLEALNGVLLVVYLGIMAVFGRYVFEALFRLGLADGYKERKAAIAVSVLIFGDLIVRTCVWSVRHLENHYSTHPNQPLVATVTAVGAATCILGGVCILRHFAPRKYGHWPSIITVTVALAFGIGMAL